MMKQLLCILPTLDMESTIGATPYFNQLIEKLDKLTDLRVIKSLFLSSNTMERAIHRYIWKYRKPYRYMERLCKANKAFQPDMILIIHDFRFLRSGNMKLLRKTFPNSKIVFYDIEAPLNFPEYMTDPRYGLSPYLRVDLSLTDGVIIPSAGCKKDMIERFKAPSVFTMYFGIESGWYPTEPRAQPYDVTYLGMSTYYREDAIREMVSIPSEKMSDKVFVVSSRNHFDFGRAEVMYGSISFDRYTVFPRQSKLNLNITREPFTKIYASSTSRIFELAAMKSCIISNECEGMEEWYEPKKEVIVVHDAREAIETYTSLLDNEEERQKIAQRAYTRTLREHTLDKRLQGLLGFLFEMRTG